MKIQDILFIIFFLVLLFKHRENTFFLSGLVCLVVAIPLFYFWIFFSAERLIYYAVTLILAEVFLKILKLRLK